MGIYTYIYIYDTLLTSIIYILNDNVSLMIVSYEFIRPITLSDSMFICLTDDTARCAKERKKWKVALAVTVVWPLRLIVYSTIAT